ncbi:MAG: glycosyltransferase family 4 protein, partial [Solirubrobacterales bacterium]|nr:glycosyltransferase family 4 protein [Solirubrobacterales bacterium]
MRVAFLVAELGRSGGMEVIREYARRLDDAVLVVCSGEPPSAVEGGLTVRRLAEMEDEPPVDVAIATWWTTTEALWKLRAGRRAVLLQGQDFAYYRDDEPSDRLGAQAVFDLPVDWLAVSPHLARFVELLRPGASAHLVPPGIDKTVFSIAPVRRAAGEPLRVLVEGQPTLWFKGITESIAAVRGMSLPASVTLAAAEPGPAARDSGADRVIGGLDSEGMAALYAEHDVLLKLSRFEGLGLPVLEGFHTGLPCVVTPFGGMDGVVEHGINGLVVGF